MTAGRILELGWSVFRFAWRPILGAVIFAVLPAYVIRLAVDLVYGNRLTEWLTEFARASQEGLPLPPQPTDLGVALAANFLADLVLFISSLVASAAVVVIVSRVYGGAGIGAIGSVRAALGRVISLIAGQLLLWVAILIAAMLGVLLASALLVGGGLFGFLGLIALVGAVAAILFAIVRATFITIAIVLEQLGGADGFRRSWRIAADHSWRVLGYILLIGLLEFLVTLAVTFVPSLLNPLPIGSVGDIVYSDSVSAVAALIAAPIGPIVLTMLYFDLRWQHGERVPLPGGGDAAGRPSGPQI
jgi:hypothetical protein